MTPGTDRAVALRGEPKLLDTLWRPVARAAAIGLGLVGGALLVWFHAWWWVPAPLLVGVLVYELAFWLRGDRPIVATIERGALSVADRKLGSEVRFDLSAATRACLGVRRSGGAVDDAFLTFFTDAGVLLAVQLATPSRAWPEHAADLRALQPVLGGRSSLLRGLAPQGSVVRQTLHDPSGAGLDALLAAVPPTAFDGCAARVWRGAAPELDFMGQHVGPPHALLTIDPRGWELRGPGVDASGPLQPDGGGRASRVIPLFDVGEAPRVARLPLVTWRLHPAVTLAIPAPIAGAGPDPQPVSEAALHLHLPEAANVVWYLLRTLDASALPEPLRTAIADSRVAGEPLPPPLLRHVPGAISPAGTADRPPPA